MAATTTNAAAAAAAFDLPDDATAPTAALVAYLRSEADAAEQRAKSLRAQIHLLQTQYNISDDAQQRYEIEPNELPPMDEHGVPKYKGRKRGRKPKARKRKANPNRRKRQHTAYTLFVQEHYRGVRTQHPEWPSKDVISTVAKQWAQVPADEKKTWKERALATHEDEEQPDEEGEEDDVEAEDEEEDDEEDEDQEESSAQYEVAAAEEDDEEAAPPARRRTKRS